MTNSKKDKMTRVKALPACAYRYGRTDIVENEDGKKKVRLIICCGYREVETDECIICQGYSNVKFEFKVVSFIVLKKDLRFRKEKNSRKDKKIWINE